MLHLCGTPYSHQSARGGTTPSHCHSERSEESAFVFRLAAAGPTRRVNASPGILVVVSGTSVPCGTTKVQEGE